MSNTLGKKITFCRRIKDPGIYTGNFGNKVIRLMDRQVLNSEDPDEIKFLMEDPEIEILCSNEDEQGRENDRKKAQGKK